MSYRIIVTGSRSWSCPDLAHEVVARLVATYGPIEVIHGGADGVDESFAMAAWAARQTVLLHQVEAEKDGETAPRGVDMCLAVHRDLSASEGTVECLRRAWDADIPCYLIADDAGVPRRIQERP